MKRTKGRSVVGCALGLLVAGGMALAPFSAPRAEARSAMIEIGDESHATVLTVERLREAMGSAADRRRIADRAHTAIEESLAMDDAVKRMMHESVEEIINGRVLDISVTFLSGIPDILSVCLEGHPTKGLAIEACANTAVIVSGFSAAVKYRWDLIAKMTDRGNVHQLSIGPGVGFHRHYMTAWMGGDGGQYSATTLDGLLSLEYVYWLSKHFGLTAQLDLGGSYVVHYADTNREGVATPIGKLSVGLAF